MSSLRTIMKRYMRALNKNDHQRVEMAALRLFFKGYTLRIWKVRDNPECKRLETLWLMVPTWSPEMPFDLDL